MANLLDWNTLNHKVRAYLDPDNGIDTDSKAFPVLMVATILNVSDEEAQDSITEGGQDRGADAVFVDTRDGINLIHIFQFKYAVKFEGTKKNFPSNEIDKIFSLLGDILDKDKSLEDSCNPILWNKIREIWEALDKPNPLIEVHFCGNMDEMCQTEKDRAIRSFSKFRFTNINNYSLNNIVELLIKKKKNNISRRLQVVDKNYFDRTDGNIRGLICTIEASNIVKMIENPNDPKSVLNEIFDDNVRIYLSGKNKINKGIIAAALADNNSMFWYLNNGITITCDSFICPPGIRAPFVQVDNLQIVNGGQTSQALFEAYHQDAEKIRDVLVLVRIIETKSREVSSAIAESTNSQTPIKGRDLRSNDQIQKKIGEAFEGMGFFYERKSKQYQDIPKHLRVDALTAGQAHLAYALGLPEVAKKDRGRIFSDLYDTIFTDDLTVDQLLVAFRLLEVIEREKTAVQLSIRNGEGFDKTKMFLIDGAYHVLFAVGQLCDEKGVDRLNFDAVSSEIPGVIRKISAIVQEAQKIDEAFSYNRFFKAENTKNKILKSKYEQ